MNRMKKILKELSVVFFIILILFLNVGTTLIILKKSSYLSFSKILQGFGLFAFILYILYKIIFKEKIKMKDGIILILGLLGFLSYLFAYDKNVALIGIMSRYEGLLSILSYYAIFLLGTTIDKKYQSPIMTTLLITGFLQIFIGTIQTLRIKFIFGYDRTGNWSYTFKCASGTFGNPNFYSTYILMCLMYVYSHLLENKDLINKIFYAILFVFFLYGLLIGNTTSCYIAALIIIVLSLLKKINKDNIKKVLIGGISSVVVILVFLLAMNKVLNNRLFDNLNREYTDMVELFQTGITDETGNGRIYIWKEALKKMPKYYLTGIGIDNFSFLENGDYICTTVSKNYQCFDKAHNEYIQILITEGILAFVAYLSLIIYSITRYNNDKKSQLYIICAYLIQALFNISVIPIAPVFYMTLGFMNYEKK